MPKTKLVDGWLAWRTAQLCPTCKHVKHPAECKGLRNMPCGCKEAKP